MCFLSTSTLVKKFQAGRKIHQSSKGRQGGNIILAGHPEGPSHGGQVKFLRNIPISASKGSARQAMQGPGDLVWEGLSGGQGMCVRHQVWGGGGGDDS